MIQKKLSFLSVRTLLLGLILNLTLLPICSLGENTASKKKFTPPTITPIIRLQQADSLFAAANYGGAAAGYHQQLWERHRASPEMLLRLAYAQQQLGHYPAALLYLSFAQARQPRVRTWRQMASLAAQHRLVGYPATWQQELRVQMQRYYYPGLQALLGAAIVAAIWLLWRRESRGAWVGYLAYVAVVGAYLYLLRPVPAGLVARSGAALMAGPGAGAAWLSTAAIGDRLPVLGQEDIWYRVEWQRRVAFVRASDLLVVE